MTRYLSLRNWSGTQQVGVDRKCSELWQWFWALGLCLCGRHLVLSVHGRYCLCDQIGQAKATRVQGACSIKFDSQRTTLFGFFDAWPRIDSHFHRRLERRVHFAGIGGRARRQQTWFWHLDWQYLLRVWGIWNLGQLSLVYPESGEGWHSWKAQPFTSVFDFRFFGSSLPPSSRWPHLWLLWVLQYGRYIDTFLRISSFSNTKEQVLSLPMSYWWHWPRLCGLPSLSSLHSKAPMPG